MSILKGLSQASNAFVPQQVNGTSTIISEVATCYTIKGISRIAQTDFIQKFTWVGNVKSVLVSPETSLAGLPKKFLTSAGQIEIDSVIDELKKTSGLNSTAIMTHINALVGYRWRDNHVGLLFNLIRLYIILDLNERGELNTGQFPIFDEEGVFIELSFDTQKDSGPSDYFFPGGREYLNYPQYHHVDSYLPEAEDAHIDLRGFDEREAILILLMLGKWESQTNFKVDFDSEKLCDRVYYRFDHEISTIDNWFDEKSEIKLPNSIEVLEVLRKYVVSNNLYNQVFTALNIASQLLVTAVPDSAEGMVWLKQVVEVALPRFTSVRGRYPFFVLSDPGLLDLDAVNEWASFVENPYLLFTRALALAEAVNIGLSIRESRVKRLVGSSHFEERYFLQPETMFAAAVSLATGLDIPLNGMSGVYVFYPEVSRAAKVLSVEADSISPQDGLIVREQNIISIGVPSVASPFLIYPLNAFTEENPFSGSFSIPKPKRLTRTGAIYSFLDAWKVSWAAHVAGYKVFTNVIGFGVRHTQYGKFASSHWLPMLTNGLDDNLEGILIVDLAKGANSQVGLPNFLLHESDPETVVSVDVQNHYVLDPNGNKLRQNVHSSTRSISKSALNTQSRNNGTYWSSMRRTDSSVILVDKTIPSVIPAGVNGGAVSIDYSDSQ
ncbi:hypothetical protein G9P44_002168 [Scheffersomyces stipitis]|nr:hypothetical protein G9P44_002168 [Scheffersomyces stipitis]